VKKIKSDYNLRIYQYPNGQIIKKYKQVVCCGSKRDMDPLKPKKEQDPDPERALKVATNRAKQKVYQYARANSWKNGWFVTLTIDPEKLDSTDYELVSQHISTFFYNVRRSRCPNMKYIAVPELHKDGKKYHIHALMTQVDGLKWYPAIADKNILYPAGHKKEGLIKISKGQKIKDKRGRQIYKTDYYNLGYMTATPITDPNKVVSYITKYITKTLKQTVKGKKTYWHSKNLDKPGIEEYLLPPELMTEFQESIKNRLVVPEKTLSLKTVPGCKDQEITIYCTDILSLSYNV